MGRLGPLNPSLSRTSFLSMERGQTDRAGQRSFPLLEADGLHVDAVQLPMTSLSDDVATVNRALALEDGPVLLVGHSYGGEVITEAGNDPNVAGLVFVAAYALDEGESAVSLASANPTPIVSEIRVDSLGLLRLTFTTSKKRSWQQPKGPWSATAFGAPIANPAWKCKPTWFVVAKNDRVISPSLEEMGARRMNATTIAIPTSHVPMLAEPHRVAAFIEEAAERSCKN